MTVPDVIATGLEANPALLITVKRTAELLGIDRGMVAKMLSRGELRFIPLGGRQKRVLREDVDRWIKNRAARGAGELRKANDGRRRQ